MASLRILLVDDSPIFLEAAAGFLSADPWIASVGRSLSGREACAQILLTNPDLVLMDVAMADLNGLEVTRQIKAGPVSPRIVIVTLHDTPEYRMAAQAAGADGFIAKSELGTTLLPLIHTLFAGATG
jgi:DNA-binding NarL/FixJ family response regulator